MPIYVYECRSCRRRFEKLQSYNDEPIRVCPHCGGETQRVFQPVGVIFKGSGWYITDNRKSDSATVTGRGERRTDGAAESGELRVQKIHLSAAVPHLRLSTLSPQLSTP